MERLVANMEGKVTRQFKDGREYLVAPLSLIVPGVLPGSQGPLFYPDHEVAKNPQSWDGMPLLAYHPQSMDGSQVSANSAGIREKQGIGFVQKSRIDKLRNGRLGAEGWFDVERTRTVNRSILDSLENNQPIELSTGLFIGRKDPAPPGANHNGKGYEWIARDYQPDHVAILPDQIGACSIRDGCGVLVNQLEVVENAWTDAAREAAIAARRAKVATQNNSFAGGSVKALTLSNKARKLSEAANDRAGHEAALQAHKVAARVHLAAANVAEHYNNREGSNFHNAAYDAHKEAAEQHGRELDTTFNEANFASEAQRRFMWSQHPDIAEKWAHGEHAGPKGGVKKMPTKTSSDVKGPEAQQARKEQRKKNRQAAHNYFAGQSPDLIGQAAAVMSGGGFQSGGAGTTPNDPDEKQEKEGGDGGGGSGTENAWSDEARAAALEARRAHSDERDEMHNVLTQAGFKQYHPGGDEKGFRRYSSGERRISIAPPGKRGKLPAEWSEQGQKVDGFTPIYRGTTVQSLREHLGLPAHNARGEGEVKEVETKAPTAAKPNVEVKPPKAGSAQASSEIGDYQEHLESTASESPTENEDDEAVMNELNAFLLYNARWDQGARDKLKKEAPEDFAGPHESFPIKSQEDVDHAAHLIGHADDPEAVKSKIKSIAKRKGYSVPDSWKGKEEATENTITPRNGDPIVTDQQLRELANNCTCQNTKAQILRLIKPESTSTPTANSLKSPENMDDGELKDHHKRVVAEVAKRHADMDSDAEGGAEGSYEDDDGDEDEDEGEPAANAPGSMHAFDGPKGSGKSIQAGGTGTKGEYPKAAENMRKIIGKLAKSGNLSADEVALVANAMSFSVNSQRQEKLALAQRIVNNSNVRGKEARMAYGNMLMGQDLASLRIIAESSAPAQNASNYFGAGAPAFNNGSPGSVPVENSMMVPTLDYKEMASPALVERFGK